MNISFLGTGWVYGYLERHKELPHTFACNINKNSAAISIKAVESSMSNLEKQLERLKKNLFYLFP